MSNIRVLDLKSKAREEVVNAAREVLLLAESGKIIDLAWCGAKPDGSTLNYFTSTDDAHRRLASVMRLLHRLNSKMDESAQDD